jgi:hypothetical protein
MKITLARCATVGFALLVTMLAARHTYGPASEGRISDLR